jgi:NAD(P)-dependent dehydrogenase (short-subunit alcohol dehydrogenase family)
VEIQGRTFFVTGGGSGLGAATVRRLAQEGANVLLADVDEEAGEELAADIGEQTRFARADVTDEESTQGALDAAIDAFGGLHGLVNCAGIGPAEKVVGKRGVHSLDSFVKAVQINLVGTFNPIRLAAPIMMENEPTEDGERGVIVITATRLVLKKAGLSMNDLDWIEINEAFAPVVLSWADELKPDMDRVNPWGGAIAHGHPLGATGAGLMAKMLAGLEATDGQFGLKVMCIGRGMSTATIIERI